MTTETQPLNENAPQLTQKELNVLKFVPAAILGSTILVAVISLIYFYYTASTTDVEIDYEFFYKYESVKHYNDLINTPLNWLTFFPIIAGFAMMLFLKKQSTWVALSEADVRKTHCKYYDYSLTIFSIFHAVIYLLFGILMIMYNTLPKYGMDAHMSMSAPQGEIVSTLGFLFIFLILSGIFSIFCYKRARKLGALQNTVRRLAYIFTTFSGLVIAGLGVIVVIFLIIYYAV